MDYMARGVARPIDDLLAINGLSADSYIGGAWDMGKYKGEMYGVPCFESFLRYGMNYNTRLLEAAGVDTENLPETWDEWFEVHKELTKFDEAGNLLQIGLDPNDAMGEELMAADGWLVATSFGLKWFDEEAGTFNLNAPETIEFLETAKKFVDVIGVENLDGMRSVAGNDSWGGSFNSEVQALIIEGYWHCGETASEAPEVSAYNRATWIPVPESRRGVKPQGTGGHIALFFKDSGNPEGMAKAAKVLGSKSSVEIIFDNVGWIGPNKDFLPDVSKYPGLDFYFDSINEATEWSSPLKCPITGYVNDQWYELRDYVLRGTMTPEEAAAELQRRAEEEWTTMELG
jgi:ABC-type glycerol-3-phosphate transport system substrate-binding protein